MIAIIIFFSLCGLLLGYWMAIAGWEMVGEAIVCIIGMTIPMFLICIGGVCAFGVIGLAMIGFMWLIEQFPVIGVALNAIFTVIAPYIQYWWIALGLWMVGAMAYSYIVPSDP